jgi:hypothetical protein
VEVTRLREELEEKRAQQQGKLDEAWARLNANDPVTVIDVVDDAFEDNKAPAAPVNVEGSVLSLVMLAPGPITSPTRSPQSRLRASPQ